MPVFKIQHTTTYQYQQAVKESVNQIRIFAFQTPAQELVQHELFITGSPEVLQFTDYWGNRTGVFNLLPPHRELVIDSRLTVRTAVLPEPVKSGTAGFAELTADVQGNLRLLELAKPDLIAATSAISGMAAEITGPQKSVAAIVQDCCEAIFQDFKYIKGITNVETTLDEILETRAGVCQDFAHIMLQVLRYLHIPSRYVSGYICPNKDGLRGEGATHAWVEAWLPGQGWTGIDPTNNVWVTNTHVKLAVGRNFNDCSPVKGSFKGVTKQTLSVFVSVGYEDGHVFEEMNDVMLEEQPEVVVQHEDEFGGQQ